MTDKMQPFEVEPPASDEDMTRYAKYVQNFRSLFCADQIEIYNNLVKRVARQNLPEDRKKLACLKRYGQIETFEPKIRPLAKEECLVVRMDLYGSIDRPDERKLSDLYKHFMRNPIKKRLSVKSYDFSVSPSWRFCRQFNSFRRIEKKLQGYLTAQKISPEILKIMTIRDISDLVFKTFQKHNEPKVIFQKQCTVRSAIVKDIAALHGEKIRNMMLSEGYEERYVNSMLHSMKRFGATNAMSLVVTEMFFTPRVLSDLKKAKIPCAKYKKGDRIPEDLIDYLIDNKMENLVCARDNKGRKLLCKGQTEIPELLENPKLISEAFPSLEGHHNYAVGEGHGMLSLPLINDRSNIILLTDAMHRLIHSTDVTRKANKAQPGSYSRRLVFKDKDAVFILGFDPERRIHYEWPHSRSWEKRTAEDLKYQVSYEDCMAELNKNLQSYMVRKTPKKCRALPSSLMKGRHGR